MVMYFDFKIDTCILIQSNAGRAQIDYTLIILSPNNLNHDYDNIKNTKKKKKGSEGYVC